MERKIELLDCTLRDGSYINDSHFGTPVIKGIIKKMQDARVDIIECGWLKDKEYEEGSAYYHVPSDLEPYLLNRTDNHTYVVMIDWDRYDVSNLPNCDGHSIDAIRVVFPHGKHREGITVGKEIQKKGYKLYLQAANTMAYSDEDLKDLAACINQVHPVALSVVDTFGAMLFEDLERIVKVLDKNLESEIKLGFHSHTNQQLSFALSIYFINLLKNSGRNIVVDASLCGMGRGAGNATTELMVSYLNRKEHGNYDLDSVMDAIDLYITGLQEKYSWGYSTPYFIAGLYQCHVNNIAYLLNNHRTNAKDMRNIISSLSQAERRKYDYDLLESKYMENQSRMIEDEAEKEKLHSEWKDRTVLLVAPWKSINDKEEKIKKFIAENNPVVIGVNAINPRYEYDYVFFVNSARYDYAAATYKEQFENTKHILLSNIKTTPGKNEIVFNFNRAIKRGWPHFDNAVICCLRLLNQLNITNIAIAGFDGFKTKYNESYADESLPTLNPDNKWDELNEEIKEMFRDFVESTQGKMKIQFVTESYFEK